MWALIFVLFLTELFVPSYGDISNCEMSSKQIHYHLRNDLLCDYYFEVRPKMDHTNATKVFVRMIVQSIIFEPHSNTITVNNWMPMSWTDDHLKWQPSNYGDVDLIHLSSSEIWTPDLSLYNKYHQDSVQKIFDSDVDCIVRYTGKVTCVPPNKHEAVCTADLRKYPYDKQECALRLGSWVHSGEEIDFRFSPTPVLMDNVENSQWKLLNVSATKHSGNYSCCPNNTYPSLIYTFSLARHPSYHEATIIVPALVLITITLFIFCLTVTENERLYLVLINIFFHFVFIQDLTWTLPNVGDYPPNILIFGRDSLILGMIQFITTLILRRIIKTTTADNVGWLSRTVNSVIQSRVGQTILVFDNSLKAVAIAKGDEDGTNIIEQSSNTSNPDYFVFAKLLDRLLCLIFIVIYAVMFIKFVP